MARFFSRFRLLGLAAVLALVLALPGSASTAGQPRGFILLSAGKDGLIGTPDDLYGTEKGEVAKGKVDLTALGLARSDLVPSSGQRAETEPVFIPASIVLVSDRTSAPADGRTSVTVTAEVRGQDGGLAPDGTEVRFSTTAGALSSAVAWTSNGLASVTLTSGTSGRAEVSASVDGVTSNTVAIEFTGIANVALSKPYWKSHVPNGQYPDSYDQEFTDGNLASHFSDGLGFGYRAINLGVSSTGIGQLEITVDLGETFPVYGVELYSGSLPYLGYTYYYGADILQVLVSADGMAFVSVGSIGTLGVDQNYLTLQFSPLQARYVRFRIQKKFDLPSTYRDWLFINEGRVYAYQQR